LTEPTWIASSRGNFAVIAGATPEGKQTAVIAASILLTIVGTFAFFAVLLRLV